MNIEISDRLVALRRESGLSQEELAAKLGVSRQAVSKWERCESSPDTDNLIALARLYGVSLDALLLDGGTATQAQPQSVPNEPYNPAQYDDGPSLYEQQLHWETGDHERRREKLARLRRFLLCFPFPVLVTALYLGIGFALGWWHPGWILFFTIPVYYCVVGAMK